MVQRTQTTVPITEGDIEACEGRQLGAQDEEGQDKAVLIIKQGLVDHSFVADPEINLSATLIKLGRLK